MATGNRQVTVTIEDHLNRFCAGEITRDILEKMEGTDCAELYIVGTPNLSESTAFEWFYPHTWKRPDGKEIRASPIQLVNACLEHHGYAVSDWRRREVYGLPRALITKIRKI